MFGVNINDTQAIDQLLLPLEIQVPGEKRKIYDCAIDVAALPGASVAGGDEDRGETYDEGVEALMTVNLAAKSDNLRHVAFRRTKYHGLRLFVDPHQDNFYNTVAEAMEHERE
jgi:hypothetical protein